MGRETSDLITGLFLWYEGCWAACAGGVPGLQEGDGPSVTLGVLWGLAVVVRVMCMDDPPGWRFWFGGIVAGGEVVGKKIVRILFGYKFEGFGAWEEGDLARSSARGEEERASRTIVRRRGVSVECCGGGGGG